jgi:hypothetical protein
MTNKHRKRLINQIFKIRGVLFWGLKASPVAWKQVNCNFLSKNFFIFISFLQFLVIKTLNPFPDPFSLEMLDPDPNLMNPDQRSVFFYFSWVIFALLDLDSESGFGFRIQIRIPNPGPHSEFESNPDSKNWILDLRIFETAFRQCLESWSVWSVNFWD